MATLHLDGGAAGVGWQMTVGYPSPVAGDGLAADDVAVASVQRSIDALLGALTTGRGRFDDLAWLQE